MERGGGREAAAEVAEEWLVLGVGVGDGACVEGACFVGEVDDAELAELGDGEAGNFLEGLVELEGGEEVVGGVGEDAEASLGRRGAAPGLVGLGPISGGDLVLEPRVQLSELSAEL